MKSKNAQVSNGSILILSTFLILGITMITVTYWKLIQIRVKLLTQKKYSTQAYYAARAGIEDAVYEFKIGNNWNQNEINEDWIKINETTFYKTNKDNTALEYFDYPVSFSIQILGDITTGFVTINSYGSVKEMGTNETYNKHLIASITKSFDNEIIIHSIQSN